MFDQGQIYLDFNFKWGYYYLYAFEQIASTSVWNVKTVCNVFETHPGIGLTLKLVVELIDSDIEVNNCWLHFRPKWILEI